MIQPYPQATHEPGTGQPPVPVPVRAAVAIMYGGAVVTAVHAVVTLLARGATRTAIEAKHPTMSAGTVNTVTNVGVIGGAVAALIGAALFVWIARSCRRGRNWARVTGTVLFVVAVVGTIVTFSNATATVNVVFALVEDVIGLAAVVLLWLGGSSAWFRLFSRPQL